MKYTKEERLDIMIHAYDKLDLDKAQTCLARMLDFAVYELQEPLEDFFTVPEDGLALLIIAYTRPWPLSARLYNFLHNIKNFKPFLNL